MTLKLPVARCGRRIVTAPGPSQPSAQKPQGPRPTTIQITMVNDHEGPSQHTSFTRSQYPGNALRVHGCRQSNSHHGAGINAVAARSSPHPHPTPMAGTALRPRGNDVSGGAPRHEASPGGPASDGYDTDCGSGDVERRRGPPRRAGSLLPGGGPANRSVGQNVVYKSVCSLTGDNPWKVAFKACPRQLWLNQVQCQGC